MFGKEKEKDRQYGTMELYDKSCFNNITFSMNYNNQHSILTE